MTNNNKKPNYEYTAEENYQPQRVNKDNDYLEKLQIYYPYPYLPSDDLKEAVNLAIKLERPLLLEGEPGCGKTRLAGALAYEFTQKNQVFLKSLKNQETGSQEDNNNEQQWWDYYIWNIKSTTRARDGLYRYDAVARLRDAQLMGTNPDKLQEFIGEDETKKLKERLKDKKNYLEFGSLGKALGAEKEHDYRPILLIDEIDKADSDFANDLLLELEELRFEIPETGKEIKTPTNKPIIFITSNREKPLPEPFLRRCIYFYLDFPGDERLKEIINERFTIENNEELVEKAINRFIDIRIKLDDTPGSKPPGTSEFIEFITALLYKDINTAKDDLKDLSNKLPLLGILLKTKQDQEFYLERQKSQS